jgi:hypothetical protein
MEEVEKHSNIEFDGNEFWVIVDHFLDEEDSDFEGIGLEKSDPSNPRNFIP